MGRYSRISLAQKEIIIDFMEQHYYFAQKGIGPGISGSEGGMKLWLELTTLLNSVAAGARKDVKGWKQTWKDLKKQAKAKVIRVRCQMDHCTTEDFGDFESRVFTLCGGDQWIADSNDTLSYSISPLNGSVKRKQNSDFEYEEEEKEMKEKMCKISQLYLDDTDTQYVKHKPDEAPTEANTQALKELTAALQVCASQQMQAAEESKGAIDNLRLAVENNKSQIDSGSKPTLVDNTDLLEQRNRLVLDSIEANTRALNEATSSIQKSTIQILKATKAMEVMTKTMENMSSLFTTWSQKLEKTNLCPDQS